MIRLLLSAALAISLSAPAVAQEVKALSFKVDKTTGMFLWNCGRLYRADQEGANFSPPIRATLTAECRSLGEALGVLPKEQK
jgi:hypothetical protein